MIGDQIGYMIKITKILTYKIILFNTFIILIFDLSLKFGYHIFILLIFVPYAFCFMKIAKLRLQQQTDKSFIVHHEHYPFAPWHHHPEYELVLLLKGKGRRMVGDNVDRFSEHDLIFTGPFLPHQWIPDAYSPGHPDYNQERAFVIQFVDDFLGERFFEVPENEALKKFLSKSARGCKFYGVAKKKIISILIRMMDTNDSGRLFGLLSIFEVFSSTSEYQYLSSPASVESFSLKENESMQKALQYIMQNFQKEIQINDLLKVTNMSYATFYNYFRRYYKVPFKEYLLDIRVDYACKLLRDETLNISEIAYSCGFENLSNFNRQFRRLKSMTPSQFQRQLQESAMAY
jgi:AraC-like DNA-binding protein